MERDLEEPLLHEGHPIEAPRMEVEVDPIYERGKNIVKNLPVEYLVGCVVRYRKYVDEERKLDDYGVNVCEDLGEWIPVFSVLNGLLSSIVHGKLSCNYMWIIGIFAILYLLGLICPFWIAYKKWWRLEIKESGLKKMQTDLSREVNDFLEACMYYNLTSSDLSTGVTPSVIERLEDVSKVMMATYIPSSTHFGYMYAFVGVQAFVCGVSGPLASYFILCGGDKLSKQDHSSDIPIPMFGSDIPIPMFGSDIGSNTPMYDSDILMYGRDIAMLPMHSCDSHRFTCPSYMRVIRLFWSFV